MNDLENENKSLRATIKKLAKQLRQAKVRAAANVKHRKNLRRAAREKELLKQQVIELGGTPKRIE